MQPVCSQSSLVVRCVQRLSFLKSPVSKFVQLRIAGLPRGFLGKAWWPHRVGLVNTGTVGWTKATAVTKEKSETRSAGSTARSLQRKQSGISCRLPIIGPAAPSQPGEMPLRAPDNYKHTSQDHQEPGKPFPHTPGCLLRERSRSWRRPSERLNKYLSPKKKPKKISYWSLFTTDGTFSQSVLLLLHR